MKTSVRTQKCRPPSIQVVDSATRIHWTGKGEFMRCIYAIAHHDCSIDHPIDVDVSDCCDHPAHLCASTCNSKFAISMIIRTAQQPSRANRSIQVFQSSIRGDHCTAWDWRCLDQRTLHTNPTHSLNRVLGVRLHRD